MIDIDRMGLIVHIYTTRVLLISSWGVILGPYFGMIVLFRDNSNSWVEDCRGWKWSGDLLQILIYPKFDLMGDSRHKNLEIDFHLNITSQNIILKDFGKSNSQNWGGSGIRDRLIDTSCCPMSAKMLSWPSRHASSTFSNRKIFGTMWSLFANNHEIQRTTHR